MRRRGSEEGAGRAAVGLGGGAEQREAARGVRRIAEGVEGLPAGPAEQRGAPMREGFEAVATVVAAEAALPCGASRLSDRQRTRGAGAGRRSRGLQGRGSDPRYGPWGREGRHRDTGTRPSPGTGVPGGTGGDLKGHWGKGGRRHWAGGTGQGSGPSAQPQGRRDLRDDRAGRALGRGPPGAERVQRWGQRAGRSHSTLFPGVDSPMPPKGSEVNVTCMRVSLAQKPPLLVCSSTRFTTCGVRAGGDTVTHPMTKHRTAGRDPG